MVRRLGKQYTTSMVLLVIPSK